MRASSRRSVMELINYRDKASRLLRRIAPIVQSLQTNDRVIDCCTENTFVDCMFLYGLL